MHVQRHAPWIGALLLALLQIALFHDLRHDDAYITYRYGQNLARGEGLDFNSGERHLATTSPGQALISAAVYSVAGQQATPSVMAALGCLGWSAQALAVYYLLLPLIGRLRAAGVALAFGLGAAGSYHWVALETHLAVACTLWALALAQREQLAQRGKWTATAALCAVAGLLRPDAYLLTVLLGGACIWHLRRRILDLWRPAVVFAAISAPWYIFATWYYGSPLPQSAVTKFQRVELSEYAAHIAEHAAGVLLLRPGFGVTLVAWTLVIVGTVWLLRTHHHRAPLLWTLPTYGAAHFAAYLVLRPYADHTWHLYPGVAVFVVLALASIAAATGGPGSVAIDSSGVGSAGAGPRNLVALVLVLLLASYGARFVGEARGHATAYWSGARDQVYRQMADHLRAHTQPDDLILSVEVGTLAYWSDRPMADLGGLVTPPNQLATKLEGSPDGPHRWMVLDKLYLHLAGGRRPIAGFRAGDSESGDFQAYLFDLEPNPTPGTD